MLGSQAAPHQLSESGQAVPCFHGFKKPDPACSQTDRHLICARKPINIDCRVPRLLAAWLLLCSLALSSPWTPPASLRTPQSQMTALSLIVPRRSRPPVVQGASLLLQESLTLFAYTVDPTQQSVGGSHLFCSPPAPTLLLFV